MASPSCGWTLRAQSERSCSRGVLYNGPPWQMLGEIAAQWCTSVRTRHLLQLRTGLKQDDRQQIPPSTPGSSAHLLPKASIPCRFIVSTMTSTSKATPVARMNALQPAMPVYLSDLSPLRWRWIPYTLPVVVFADDSGTLCMLIDLSRR